MSNINPQPSNEESPPKVAVVLSGAVARGAFQAGALGTILESLDEQDLQPSMIFGTSAGAINAALWANAMHSSANPADVAREVGATWEAMGSHDVYEAPLSWNPREIWGSFERLGWPAIKGFFRGHTAIPSLLDTRPLHETASEHLPDPLTLPPGLDTVGVVATWVPRPTTSGSASGRSTLFLQERRPSKWRGRPDRALDVERCDIRPEHVLASSAVPAFFSPVLVDHPKRGWYVDGGVRLNTPLLAAIELGATHVVVISAMSVRYADLTTPNEEPPTVVDAASQAIHALLADRTVEDLLAVEKTNWLVNHKPPNFAWTSRRGRKYREIKVSLVAPPAGELRHKAQQCWDTKYKSGKALLKLEDNSVLGRLLRSGGDTAGRQELLSYILFDENYFKESRQAGVEAAKAVLDMAATEPQGLWRSEDLLAQPAKKRKSTRSRSPIEYRSVRWTTSNSAGAR